ncbi:MAG: MFS transporter [Rhizobiaceae bacterium]
MSAPLLVDRKRVILLLAVAGFASSANQRMLDSALPQIAIDFGVSNGMAAQVNTAYALSYSLMQIGLGFAGDRLGKYRMVFFLCLFSSAATSTAAAAYSVESLLVARFLAGAAASAIIPMSLAWIGDNVPFSERQPVLARYMVGSIMGLVFGQLIGGVLTGFADWRLVPVVAGCVYLIVTLGLLIESRRMPFLVSRSVSGSGLPFGEVLKRVLGRPWSRRVLLAVSIEGFALFGTITFISISIASRFAINPALVGAILALYAVGSAGNSLIVGRLLPIMGRSRFFMLAASFAIAGMALVSLASVLPLVAIGVAVMGLGGAGMHNSLQTFGTQLLPEARASGFAFFATCLFLSQSIGVAVYGILITAYDITAPFLVGMVLVAILGLWFATVARKAPEA